MGRAERKQLITKIEAARGSRVLCYVTGDRQPIQAQISDDAVRPIYAQLRALGKVEKLDVFIYSRGGAVDTPWRIATAIRQTAKQWGVLIPFRANSAATLLALGADQIVMGNQGELGPIDPTLQVKRVVPGQNGQGTVVQDAISVEDVMAFMRFLEERCHLSEQAALAAATGKLIDRVDAVMLGNLYRTHSHIRDVAKRMLLSRSNPPNEETQTTIIRTLAEQVYAHGHAIGASAAKDIGLPIHDPDAALEQLLWDLMADYEAELKLLEPLDPVAAVGTADLYSEETCISVVESSTMIHRHQGRLEIRAKRQVPPQLNVAVNMQLQLQPPAIQPGAQQINLQPLAAQLLQQIQQQAVQLAQAAVQEALAKQAPLVGVDVALRNGQWVQGV